MQGKTFLLAGVLLIAATAQAMAEMPTPVVRFKGTAESEIRSKTWVTYHLGVVNHANFDPALFTSATTAAPPTWNCPSHSRATFDILDANGARHIYGFCSFDSNEDLVSLWFRVEKGKPAPKRVFVAITDTLTHQIVRSNAVTVHETAGPIGEEIRTGAGLCLDVHEPEMRTNGGRVQVWACNGADQQSWTYDFNWRAVRVASGLCLDVRENEIVTKGGHVQVWTCNRESQQRWTPQANGSLRNEYGFCLDVNDPDQATNGGRVQVWPCDGSRQQRFTSIVF